MHADAGTCLPFEAADGRFVLYDPANDAAWIASDLTVAVLDPAAGTWRDDEEWGRL
ncbi:MAG: hypothetical protein ABEJ23_03145 [Haloarculaceae archaeon]